MTKNIPIETGSKIWSNGVEYTVVSAYSPPPSNLNRHGRRKYNAEHRKTGTKILVSDGSGRAAGAHNTPAVSERNKE